MVKYCGHYVTAQEVPNEISLVFSITNCPHHCEGCHSPWLQADIGDELTQEDIAYYIKQYKDGITCVCFMGTGNDYVAIRRLVDFVRASGYKTCVYTGDHRNDIEDYGFPDYFKEGKYVQSLGGLDHPTTNQRMWKKNEEGKYEDITSWFWKKKE